MLPQAIASRCGTFRLGTSVQSCGHQSLRDGVGVTFEHLNACVQALGPGAHFVDWLSVEVAYGML
jgi:hypothetical protein